MQRSRMLSMVVGYHGWHTTITRNLRQGMDEIAATPFDAVILDLNLDDSHWPETVARLVEIRDAIRQQNPVARFVVASGFIPPGTIPDGICDDVLRKSEDVSVQRLMQAITGQASQP